ncbi:hypothetical protein C8Q75DRAFT_613049 [Abortiporus biennis]|nr:hypothetical protein C8Q75DRAFT_613049 [Abortiporus biennis]
MQDIIFIVGGDFIPFKTIAGCSGMTIAREIVLVVVQIIVGVILFLRTVALYAHSLKILIFLLGTGIMVVGVALWSVISEKAGSASVELGCFIEIQSDSGFRLASAWEAVIAYDILIFSMTLFKAFQERRYRHTILKGGLVCSIFRDGAIYFAVLACVNIANTLTIYGVSPAVQINLSTLALSVSVTLISRLMVNLQKTALDVTGTSVASGPLPIIESGGIVHSRHDAIA